MVIFEAVTLTGWIRRILHIGQFRLVSQCLPFLLFFCSGEAATGDEAATEGEADFGAFVFAPGTERHHDDSAVVFRSILKSLTERERRVREGKRNNEDII